MNASGPNDTGHSADSAWTLAFLAWLIASASTLAALFLSQVIAWFGFLTIPLLSLIAFSLVGILLLLTHPKVSK